MIPRRNDGDGLGGSPAVGRGLNAAGDTGPEYRVEIRRNPKHQRIARAKRLRTAPSNAGPSGVRLGKSPDGLGG